MSYKIRWSPEAADDLLHIADFIAFDSPENADAVADRIYERIGRLAQFPHTGRRGVVAGSRELVLTPLPFVVVYRVVQDAVEVSRILHGAQRWPRSSHNFPQ